MHVIGHPLDQLREIDGASHQPAGIDPFAAGQHCVRPLLPYHNEDALNLRGVPSGGSIEVSEIPNRPPAFLKNSPEEPSHPPRMHRNATLAVEGMPSFSQLQAFAPDFDPSVERDAG